MLRLILILLALATPLAAEEKIVLGLSQNRVAITANFDGSEILIFGAVKRDQAVKGQAPLQVIVAVTGPSEQIVVRRKQRVFGIWANKDAVEISGAPSFYAVAATGPLDELLSEGFNRLYHVSINNTMQPVNVPEGFTGANDFTAAVIRIREDDGLFIHDIGTVDLSEETLFRTSIALPSNLVEGDYRVRTILTRDKQVVDVSETTIAVRKVGLERFIFSLAHERPLVYGLLSLTIAILAGWAASAVFRLLRLA